MPTTGTLVQTAAACPSCTAVMGPHASFCSNCGRAARESTRRHAVPNAHVLAHRPFPAFVQATPGPSRSTLAERNEELEAATSVLLRERIFLVTHWTLFLGLNLWGLSLAVEGYGRIIGDHLTKLVMAGTPIMFINASTLMFLVVICGTRRQIARAKERVKYIQFQIDYSSLL